MWTWFKFKKLSSTQLFWGIWNFPLFHKYIKYYVYLAIFKLRFWLWRLRYAVLKQFSCLVFLQDYFSAKNIHVHYVSPGTQASACLSKWQYIAEGRDVRYLGVEFTEGETSILIHGLLKERSSAWASSLCGGQRGAFKHRIADRFMFRSSSWFKKFG